MSRTVSLFGIDFNAVTLEQTVETLYGYMKEEQDSCRYVVTVNVDNCVTHRSNEAYRAACRDAALRVVDGRPVLAASRLLGTPLPGLVPGSDLVPALLEAAAKRGGLRVYLLGAMPGVAERAAKSIHARWAGVEVVGLYSPPFGFEHDADETRRILDKIEAAQPQLLVLGFGAPKQENWLHRELAHVKARVAIGAGATIDFLAGESKRAPKWMRRLGLEWLHRMLGEPRRLVRRYLYDAMVLPVMLWEEWKTRRKRKTS